MREEFEKLVVAGKLEGKHIEPLCQLVSSGYCVHRSWGFGRITTVDTVFARFTIDFENKAGHFMDLGFAAESLRPIAASHILARKAADLEGLRQKAALNHLDLIKLVLESYGGRATVDQIQQVLVPDVISSDWKKWWETAKREMKKDGHFVVPTKKSEPIIYQSVEVALQDRLMSEFRLAKGLKAKVTAAQEILRNAEDLSDRPAAAQEILAALNADITSHQRTQPAAALEAVFTRDDIQAMIQQAPTQGDLVAKDIWELDQTKFGQIMEQTSAAKHRRMLVSFKDSMSGKWDEVLLGSLNHLSTKLCSEAAHLLIQEGKLPQLKEVLARLISHHQANTDMLLWLAKERSDSFADILGPEVFRAMLTAMERDQFNEKRSNKLRDYILDDQDLLVELIGSADLDVIKDLTRTLQLSPCFEDMDKRSLLARIVKSYPAVQSLISGEQTKQETTWLVSWESLERRKSEYGDLVHKKIPANSKEIALARSYGDLRENHEYKAAKEMQKILMRRKTELESQLVRARGTDFANARADVVSIGTTVQVTDLQTQQLETYSILGAWDSNPEQGIVSYLTPIAQALLNHKPGDQVDFEFEGAKKSLRVEAIKVCQIPGLTAQPVNVPVTASPAQMAPPAHEEGVEAGAQSAH